MNENRIQSSFRGCLLACAVGDALGYPVEFRSYEQILEQYGDAGITGYDLVFDREYAVVTDDTQMTLFTAAGLLEEIRRRGNARTLDTAWGSIYEARRLRGASAETSTQRLRRKRVCMRTARPE